MEDVKLDLLKHNFIFEKLSQVNPFIKETSLLFKYAKEGEDYDFKKGVISGWFNPDNVKKLGFSRTYPHKCPEQYRREYCLSIHQSNYLGIFLLSLLYSDRKNVLIEDIGAGAGCLFIYLKSLGFSNFHAIDNFSQLSQQVFETYMEKSGIQSHLNDTSLKPVISNNVGVPCYAFREDADDDLELILCYTNRTLEAHLQEVEKKGKYKFLCRDTDDLCVAYCRVDKYNEYKEKIRPFVCEDISGKPIPQYEPVINSFEKQAVQDYMENPGYLTEYTITKSFEKEISNYLGTRYCITTNNGTISLSLALLASGVGAGDKVIVPDITMIATPNAVSFIGACPVFVDVGNDLLLDLEKAKTRIEQGDIKAVIFVSLNGRTKDNSIWDFLMFCKKKKVPVIEDAAQSFGSRNYEGFKVGARGFCVSSFSFSSPKIITTGQGGCLVTNDEAFYKKLMKLKDFGRTCGGIDIHDDFGINSKFTEIQAVIGKAQLKDIEYRTERKKAIFDLYRHELGEVPQIKFIETNLNYTVPWFVDIFVEDPVALQNYLRENKIGTRLLYPSIHTQQIYKQDDVGFETSLKWSKQGIWLPCSFNLTDEQIKKICSIIKEYYNV